MKITIKETPGIGTIRTKQRFLWLPKYMKNDDDDKHVLRWLEKAVWREEYTFKGFSTGWVGLYWIDKEEDWL